MNNQTNCFLINNEKIIRDICNLQLEDCDANFTCNDGETYHITKKSDTLEYENGIFFLLCQSELDSVITYSNKLDFFDKIVCDAIFTICLKNNTTGVKNKDIVQHIYSNIKRTEFVSEDVYKHVHQSIMKQKNTYAGININVYLQNNSDFLKEELDKLSKLKKNSEKYKKYEKTLCNSNSKFAKKVQFFCNFQNIFKENFGFVGKIEDVEDIIVAAQKIVNYMEKRKKEQKKFIYKEQLFNLGILETVQQKNNEEVKVYQDYVYNIMSVPILAKLAQVQNQVIPVSCEQLEVSDCRKLTKSDLHLIMRNELIRNIEYRRQEYKKHKNKKGNNWNRIRIDNFLKECGESRDNYVNADAWRKNRQRHLQFLEEVLKQQVKIQKIKNCTLEKVERKVDRIVLDF